MAGARRKAGRMPFMPAVRLNQLCCAATEAGYPSRFLARGFSPVRFLLFLFLFCSSSFGPFNVLLSERERSLWWARFKLLSAGAGSKHGDLCNEQIRDSSERSNLSCGFVRPSAIEDARRCCQKIHLRTSEFKFQWLPPHFF